MPLSDNNRLECLAHWWTIDNWGKAIMMFNHCNAYLKDRVSLFSNIFSCLTIQTPHVMVRGKALKAFDYLFSWKFFKASVIEVPWHMISNLWVLPILSRLAWKAHRWMRCMVILRLESCRLHLHGPHSLFVDVNPRQGLYYWVTAV